MKKFMHNSLWKFRGFVFIGAVSAISGLSAFAQPTNTDVMVDVQEKRVWKFPEAGVQINNMFSGARVNGVEQTGESEFRILVRPENSPINNSAWYAFEVSSDRTQTISVTLAYEGGRHRYQPKISDDGLVWEALPDSDWAHNREENTAVLRLRVGPKPIRIAGQEMVGNEELRGWMNEMTQRKFIQKTEVGKSMLGQSIEALRIGSPDTLNYVFIIGRQHPPEITGSLGLIHFVENLSRNSPQANKYREQFQTIVIPLMNPDGVDHGHWRHNMSGVDLNRDWLDFTQPETAAARDLFKKLAARDGAQVFLFLDFHSTHRDVFYTQKDENPTYPPDFTAKWLAALEERLPDYTVRRQSSYGPNSLMSKGWGYDTFGAPSITYEFGDTTDRELIRKQTTVASDEMMRLLLEASSQLSQQTAQDRLDPTNN